MNLSGRALPTGAKALGRYLEGVRFPIRKRELVATLEGRAIFAVTPKASGSSVVRGLVLG